jgi:hypothetical protein
MAARTCTTCVLCLREDYGYSNYTVEGTTLACLAGLNPEMEGREDEQWNESRMAELAPILDVALTCPRYREGAPASLDVDHEDIPYPTHENVTVELLMKNYTDDRDAAKLLLARLANDGNL